jgi:5'-nucleotidase
MGTLSRRVSILLALLAIGFWPAAVRAEDCSSDHRDEERADLRQIASHRVSRSVVANSRLSAIKLLGLNDFHGQLSEGRLVGTRKVGSAGVLFSYLRAAERGVEDQTLLVHAGDLVGASGPTSALLQDEPAMMLFNQFANSFCKLSPSNSRCNVVMTLGNHEFDQGRGELFRKIFGGNHPKGPFLENPYSGAAFPWISANAVDELSSEPILPPYTIKEINGVRIGFIGALLKETPQIVSRQGVAGMAFLDEADTINKYVVELQNKGVHAIVVVIHQGGFQSSYQGPTRDPSVVTGQIKDIVLRLDDDVDVVVSGHSHGFTNAFLPTARGKLILVSQAFSYSTAYADIDLQVDLLSGDVVSVSAAVVTTFADAGPGLTPDADALALTRAAEERVAPLVNRVIGTASTAITRVQSAAGESAIGNLVTDGHIRAMAADFAFINPGGIRDDIQAGSVTWGKLFSVQPFGNVLVKMNLTGQQIYDLLEQQWIGRPSPNFLQVSGLSYTWDALRADGSRVVEIRKGGVPIDRAGVFSVAVNNFLADGGSGYTVFLKGTARVGGPIDVDALVDHVGLLPQPFSAAIEGRVVRLN